MEYAEAFALIETYGRAWATQDPDLILTVFTEDATYNDPSVPENHGHAGIRRYWVDKVVGEQKNIHFHMKHVWVDGDTVIAEWEATFTDTKRKLKVHLAEVGIFTVVGKRFGALREYYKSIKTPLL